MRSVRQQAFNHFLGVGYRLRQAAAKESKQSPLLVLALQNVTASSSDNSLTDHHPEGV
jgi:hypothetical protein